MKISLHSSEQHIVVTQPYPVIFVHKQIGRKKLVGHTLGYNWNENCSMFFCAYC